MAPEPFVSAQEAAEFVGISRRFLIELARRGIQVPIRSGLATCGKHGYSVFPNSPRALASLQLGTNADRRKASERIIQLLGVPH